MALLRPRVWTSQPQVPVGIDWSNPLTRGLIVWINPAQPGDCIQVGGSQTYRGTSGGVSHVGTATTLLTKNCQPLGSSATVLYVGDTLTSAAGGIIAAFGNQGAGNQFFGFQASAPGTAHRIVVRTVNAGGITSAESTSVPANISRSPDRPDIWMAVYDGSANATLYLNGKDDTASRNNTAASGAFTSVDNFSLGGVNRGTDSFSTSSERHFLGAGWNRALSASEVKALSDNPWQLFSPLVT